MWSLYKNSDEGKKVIDLFDFSKGANYNDFQNLADYSKKWGDIPEDLVSDAFYFFIENVNAFPVWENPTFSREEFYKFVEGYDIVEIEVSEDGSKKFLENNILLPKDRYRVKNNLMGFLSLSLYYSFPEHFKPLFHKNNFPIIQKNCDALGIEMPPIPRTKDYKEYMMYYWDICQNWNKFQIDNNLTNAEFCACLYDYAPRLIMPIKKTDMPQPTNVWLVGAAKEDFDFVDNLGNTEGNPQNIWQCNERTKRGDLVVIYCRSPRSYIHSIWRANTCGIFNPFDYYQCRTTICDGIKINPITIKDLKSHSYLSQMPIVRKNLQGVNGVELSAKDYYEIINFLKERGDDVSNLPQLFNNKDIDFGEIAIEKDVEEKILIPLLNRIGYKEEDWTRQLSQKAGRGLKAIPDFVFLHKGETHFASAPLVIEAKFDMSHMTERINAFSQCLSYARMLRSKIMAICDKERLVIYNVDQNGSSDINNPVFEDHWSNIYNDEVIGSKLNKTIGREVISSL